MILDAETHEQVAAVDRILAGVDGRELPGRAEDRALRLGLRDEHRRLRERRPRSTAALPALRRAAAAAAAAEGLAIAAAATHPFALPEAQPIVKEERYVTFVGYGGISVRRQGVQGLHVHVGMPSRRGVLALPRGDPPVAAGRARALGELALVRRRADRAWRRTARRCSPSCRARARRRRSPRTPNGRRGSSGSSRLGVAEDYTRIWWDVRPHPKLGTLEVRDRRPADRRRVSRPRSRRCCRRCARRRSTAGCRGRARARRSRPRRLRAEPLGGRALRPARRAAASRRASVRPGVRARRRAARARARRRRARSAASDALARHRPERLRGGPAAAARDSAATRRRTSSRGR